MKKVISIILLFILILMQFVNYAYAENSCSISLSPDNQSLNKSDILTVSVTMSNITIQDGVTAFYSLLDYSEDMFELIIDESEDAKIILQEFEGTDYEDCKILYMGQNDEDEEILNPWTLLLLESEGEKGLIGITDEPQKQTQKIAKIKFKVKDDAKTSNGEKITLEELCVMDKEDNEITLSNAYTTVNVIGAQQITINNTTANKATNTNTNKNTASNTNKNNSNNTNKNSTSTYNKVANNAAVISNSSQTADESVPDTGSPIVLPIFLIMIAFIVYKYKKYNEIKNI